MNSSAFGTCLWQFKNPRFQWIPQILRTATRKWICPHEITSIARVFQQDLDGNQNEGHRGMSNLFLLHHNHEWQCNHIHSCHLFCSHHPRCLRFATDCHQERVRCELQVLRAAIGCHLGRFSEKQGQCTSALLQVVVGREALQFSLSKAGDAICPASNWAQLNGVKAGFGARTSFEVAAACLLFLHDLL